MRWRLALGVVALSLLGGVAHAADAYMDDRSTADSLVRSLYNAINMQDYARAYSYFSDPPAKDFDTYTKGFESTEHVDVLLGAVSGDGAAGSIYLSVPTAIRAKDKDGKFSYFAGCYVVRQINGGIQDPPYRPLEIQSAKLKPAKEDDFERYSLPKCGDAEPADDSTASTVESAKAKFVAEARGECDKVDDTLAGLNEPEVHVISYKSKGASKSDPPSKSTLYVFSCSMAAYNEDFVFYIDNGAIGLERLSFAEPHMDITYSDSENAKLKSMRVTGFQASNSLVNAGYDDKTRSIGDFSKWRGVADASSNGTWVFDDGQFVLQDFDVDPTYDGNMNSIPVVRHGQVVLKP